MKLTDWYWNLTDAQYMALVIALASVAWWIGYALTGERIFPSAMVIAVTLGMTVVNLTHKRRK